MMQTSYLRVFTPYGLRAHLIFSDNLNEQSARSVCGLQPKRGRHWLNEVAFFGKSKGEEIETLPLCENCSSYVDKK